MMRNRFPLVVVAVLLLSVAAGTAFWLTRTGDGPVTIDAYRRSGSDDRRLTVRFTLGAGDTITLAVLSVTLWISPISERGFHLVRSVRSVGGVISLVGLWGIWPES
ncbi:hypothetical protein [Dactylosporangium sp. NPDC048998]|uniref:hypothetical protein n=1 Tax=Dactylosporangium sp. NPDC048998 TaxID=3363976 RepID=UPI003717DF3E